MIIDHDTDTISPDGNDSVIRIGGTGGLIVSSGTTSERPSGTNGLIRFNTETGVIEGFQSASWGNLVIATPGGAASTSQGGTGLTSIGTSNQILGVNNGASALEYKTVSAGTAISVTHGANSISIANTGVTSIVAGTNISISGGTGDVTINATGGGINDPGSNGILVRTALNTTSAVTITGTSNQITLTNGDGTGGNPTIEIASNAVLPGTEGVVIVSGTTAQRPGSPTDGQLRFNTSDEVLEGYASPYGTTAQPTLFARTAVNRKRRCWYDDFMVGSSAASGTALYGELGWSVTGSGTNVNAIITGISDHPGIFQLQPPQGTNGATARLHMGATATTLITLASQVHYMAWLIRVPSTATFSNMRVIAGIGTDISSTTLGTDGVRFVIDLSVDTTLRFYTRTGGVDSTATTTIATAIDTWYFLEAFNNGTSWTPVVNGVSYTAINSVPTAACNIGLHVSNTTNANKQHSVQIDSFELITTEFGNRY